jgi:hypothetical protein
MEENIDENGNTVKQEPGVSDGFDARNQELFLKKEAAKRELEMLSSKFFTEIPHNVGFSNTRDMLLDDPAKISREMALLDRCAKRKKAAVLLLDEEGGGEEDGQRNNRVSEHPVDKSYRRLQRTVLPVKRNDEVSNKIAELVNYASKHTKADCHGFKMELKKIFVVHEKEEDGKKERKWGDDAKGEEGRGGEKGGEVKAGEGEGDNGEGNANNAAADSTDVDMENAMDLNNGNADETASSNAEKASSNAENAKNAGSNAENTSSSDLEAQFSQAEKLEEEEEHHYLQGNRSYLWHGAPMTDWAHILHAGEGEC